VTLTVKRPFFKQQFYFSGNHVVIILSSDMSLSGVCHNCASYVNLDCSFVVKADDNMSDCLLSLSRVSRHLMIHTSDFM
jgi:hypothetical protein